MGALDSERLKHPGPLIPLMAFTSCHDRGSNRLPPPRSQSDLLTCIWSRFQIPSTNWKLYILLFNSSLCFTHDAAGSTCPASNPYPIGNGFYCCAVLNYGQTFLNYLSSQSDCLDADRIVCPGFPNDRCDDLVNGEMINYARRRSHCVFSYISLRKTQPI